MIYLDSNKDSKVNYGLFLLLLRGKWIKKDNKFLKQFLWNLINKKRLYIMLRNKKGI